MKKSPNKEQHPSVFVCECGLMIGCETEEGGEYRAKFLSAMEGRAHKSVRCKEGRYHAVEK